MKRLVLLLVLLLVLAPPAGADDAASEQNRLSEEIRKLAARNAWSGVERTYRKLEALNRPLRAEDHLLGAKASFAEGDVATTWERLRRALPEGSGPPGRGDAALLEVAETIALVEGSFGRVDIGVHGARIPALLRPEQPFATEERTAIAFAQAQVATTRAFRGFLPAGSYVLDGDRFEVRAGGTEWQQVRVEPLRR